MIDNPATVLVVDDIEDNSEILSRLVHKIGHQTIIAANGQQALEILRSQPCDLVLLDIMMPEMNGYEVLECMKQNLAIREIPVVVVSAVTDIESIVRCVRLGADDYLFKPYNSVLLRARIDACLEKKRLRDSEQANLRQLQEERSKVDQLLHSLYPAPIVTRLKAGQQLIADAYPAVTVLFADIHDFSRITADHSPTEVVGLLNDVFSSFDHLCQEHGVEKIKTVGDAYIAASGMGEICNNSADAVADLALHMQRQAMQPNPRLREPLSLRIGIHTGPVVAGVIGTAKSSFDLWGTTMKIAAQMESTGLVGAIHVSAATYAQLRDRYLFEERGSFYVRGEGEITTQLLRGKRLF